MKYTQRYNGKPFTVKSQELTRWACCDCGLVHDLVFATRRAGQEIGVAARVNKRATAARRRKKQRIVAADD